MNPAFPLHAPPDRKDVTRPGHALRSMRCYYRVDRRDISLLRFILEAYEGVATVTTIQPAGGLVAITVAPGWEDLVKDLLAKLGARGDLRLEPLTAPPPPGQGEA